jgi:hypothetical protein
VSSIYALGFWRREVINLSEEDGGSRENRFNTEDAKA